MLLTDGSFTRVVRWNEWSFKSGRMNDCVVCSCCSFSFFGTNKTSNSKKKKKSSVLAIRRLILDIGYLSLPVFHNIIISYHVNKYINLLKEVCLSHFYLCYQITKWILSGISLGLLRSNTHTEPVG